MTCPPQGGRLRYPRRPSFGKLPFQFSSSAVRVTACLYQTKLDTSIQNRSIPAKDKLLEFQKFQGHMRSGCRQFLPQAPSVRHSRPRPVPELNSARITSARSNSVSGNLKDGQLNVPRSVCVQFHCLRDISTVTQDHRKIFRQLSNHDHLFLDES